MFFAEKGKSSFASLVVCVSKSLEVGWLLRWREIGRWLNAHPSDQLSGEGRHKTCRGLERTASPTLSDHVFAFAETLRPPHQHKHICGAVDPHASLPVACLVFGDGLGVRCCPSVGNLPLNYHLFDKLISSPKKKKRLNSLQSAFCDQVELEEGFKANILSLVQCSCCIAIGMSWRYDRILLEGLTGASALAGLSFLFKIGGVWVFEPSALLTGPGQVHTGEYMTGGLWGHSHMSWCPCECSSSSRFELHLRT